MNKLYLTISGIIALALNVVYLRIALPSLINSQNDGAILSAIFLSILVFASDWIAVVAIMNNWNEEEIEE